MKLIKPMDKRLFYILSWTWGLPMNIIGGLAALVLICAGYKPKRHGWSIYFNVGQRWGGVEFGMFFITDSSDSDYTKWHEFGHGIQNCYWGVLMPFVVSIPSAIRYWYREFCYFRGIPVTTEYDDIWFEREATQIGQKYKQYFKSGACK